MTEYRDFETDQYRLRFIKEGEDWVCRLPPSVMGVIETSVTHREAEPVAWINLEAWKSGKYLPDDCFSDEEFTGSIPLYTHPVKELTDEEIKQVITEHEWYSWTLEQFAKAILRKAQET